MATLQDFLFPSVIVQNWQMMPWERIALAGVLARQRPKVSIEIGVYCGGSLSLTSQFVEKIYAIDIDPAVRQRIDCPPNAELIIGDSTETVPRLLKSIAAKGEVLEFVLVDADHSTEGVRRDINLILEYQPIRPMIILMHDSGNPACRKGIRSAAWENSDFVQSVELDFVPGQIIEHTVTASRAEVWGGFAAAFLTPDRRWGPLEITESARTSLRVIHDACANMTSFK